MRRQYTISCVLALLCLSGLRHAVLAQSGRADAFKTARGAALVFGARHAFTLRAPDGWALDLESGRAQGLHIVTYPEGQRWAKSAAVMYCAVVPRAGNTKTLAAMLQYEADRFRNASPTAVISDEPAVQIGTRRVVVRGFSGGTNGAHERVAYVEERSVIVMMVLSCRTPEAYEAALPAFGSFVSSYTFLADDEENILRAVEAAEDEIDTSEGDR